jgi:DNA (cytosine-5)-methyltransferase 1
MNYLSVCSGIEAATVAWHDLKWKAVGYSEIEKFPSEVLHHHYPNITNFGDMTKYKDWNINESVELLVGGTPCQSFSLAGLRKGLDDPRGNLALVFCGLLDHFKPKWFVWENVPGVLSSNRGRDFGNFLGAVAKLGYGFSYRVLDAQYFGVAQRRRRVFVVGHLGSWQPSAKVLFESESLSGNIKTSKRKREDIAKCITTGIGTRLDGETDTFITKIYETHPADSRVKEMGEICQTVTSRWGTGGGNVPLALQTYNITFCDSNGTRKDRLNGGLYINETNISNIITSAGVGTNAIQNMRVRRLTPIECERLQGFPDNYTNIKDNCPDGHRYKALGNSMAIPVMKWIGERINNAK